MTSDEETEAMQRVTEQVIEFTQNQCRAAGLCQDWTHSLVLVNAVVDHTDRQYREVMHSSKFEGDLQVTVAGTLRMIAGNLTEEADRRVASVIS